MDLRYVEVEVIMTAVAARLSILHSPYPINADNAVAQDNAPVMIRRFSFPIWNDLFFSFRLVISITIKLRCDFRSFTFNIKWYLIDGGEIL